MIGKHKDRKASSTRHVSRAIGLPTPGTSYQPDLRSRPDRSWRGPARRLDLYDRLELWYLIRSYKKWHCKRSHKTQIPKVFINSAKEFGALIRSERLKRRLSQRELAEKASVSPLWLSQFERGKPTAHISLVMRTLKALGVKLWAGDLPKSSASDLEATVIDLDELIANQPEAMPINEDARDVIDPKTLENE